jgi:hypothetical protein
MGRICGATSGIFIPGTRSYLRRRDEAIRNVDTAGCKRIQWYAAIGGQKATSALALQCTFTVHRDILK